MRAIIYDFTYVKTLDDLEGISNIIYFEHDRALDSFTVKFDDGNTLVAYDSFNFIRMINAYLRYLRNGDVIDVSYEEEE